MQQQPASAADAALDDSGRARLTARVEGGERLHPSSLAVRRGGPDSQRGARDPNVVRRKDALVTVAPTSYLPNSPLLDQGAPPAR